MNPIDIDRMGIGFIRQKQNQNDSSIIKKNINDTQTTKVNEPQLADLVSLVKVSVDSRSHADKLSQIKAEIHSNTYSIDMDSLVCNLLASDHEL